MSEDTINLLLSVLFAAFLLFVIFSRMLLSRVDASRQSELFAWGYARGGMVQSIKLRYLLPWVNPQLSSTSWLFFVLAKASALLAVCMLLVLIIGGAVSA